MKQKKTKQKKIAARTVRFAVIGSVVLGIATLLAGLLIYHNTLLQVSISRGGSTVVRAAAAVQNSADVIGLSEDVMGVYSSLTTEQRSRTGTEEYRALFRQLETVTGPDGAGSILPNVLENYRTDVSAISICTLDRENSALVCLASTPGADSPAPGDWTGIPVEKALEIYRIIQEAVSNALKHANATSVSIGLHLDADNLRVLISNNGTQKVNNEKSVGIGKHTISQRASSIKGKIDFIQHQYGSTVQLTVNRQELQNNV